VVHFIAALAYSQFEQIDSYNIARKKSRPDNMYTAKSDVDDSSNTQSNAYGGGLFVWVLFLYFSVVHRTNGGRRESLWMCASRPVGAVNRRAKSVSMTSWRHTYPYGLDRQWMVSDVLIISPNGLRLYWTRSKYLISIKTVVRIYIYI